MSGLAQLVRFALVAAFNLGVNLGTLAVGVRVLGLPARWSNVGLLAAQMLAVLDIPGPFQTRVMTKMKKQPTSRSWKLVPEFEHILFGTRAVLNLGSGDGYLTEYLARRPGYGSLLNITNLDVADHSSTGQPPLIFDGEHIPFGDAQFDVTLCMYVLHHAARPERLIAEIRRVTRSSVVVTEDLPETLLDRALCVYHAVRFDHWNTRSRCFGFRSLAEWTEAFAAHGMRLARSVRLPRHSHLTNKYYPVRRALMIFEVTS